MTAEEKRDALMGYKADADRNDKPFGLTICRTIDPMIGATVAFHNKSWKLQDMAEALNHTLTLLALDIQRTARYFEKISREGR